MWTINFVCPSIFFLLRPTYETTSLTRPEIQNCDENITVKDFNRNWDVKTNESSVNDRRVSKDAWFLESSWSRGISDPWTLLWWDSIEGACETRHSNLRSIKKLSVHVEWAQLIINFGFMDFYESLCRHVRAK